jgi:chromosome segregation ATPase
MAGRKSGPSVPAPDGARAFTVVLEQLRGEFKVFGEALDGLRQHMTDRFDAVDRRFDAVDRRFERVEHELGEVKQDLGEVQRDLAEVKVDLGLVKSAATTHSRELREIRGALGNKVERGEVEAIVEHVVVRIAQR